MTVGSPNIGDKVPETSSMDPVILEPKDIGFRNLGGDINLERHMI